VRVLLLYTDADFYAGVGYDRAWRAALERHGATVDQLPGMPASWALDGPPEYDLVIPHVLVEEVAAFAPTLRAAAALEAAGARLLNPTHALLASADKLMTHAAWAAAGLPQPATYDVEALDRWPADLGVPLVLKPSFCDGARHIGLVHDLDEARATVARWRADERQGGERRGAALLQEHVVEPRCLRLFATPQRCSKAYEKSREPGALVTHGTVYPRVFEPDREVAELASAMVEALGGGLMGVDVLIDAAGRALALEANGPFGFDVTDPEQGEWVAAAALDHAALPAAR
jgi:[lysine-biosynthesis-protein LysW]---L-2-aminoadipate ligase